MFGSSDVVTFLSSLGYTVRLGGPYDITPKTLYLVIAPEKPFSSLESETILSSVRRGARLLVADETGVANSLLKNIGVKISGIYIKAKDSRDHGWEEVLRITCNIGGRKISFISTRVSYIEKYPSWMKPICWVDDPRVTGHYVYGVLGRYGDGEILVLSDSTIFANFMLRGLYPQLGNTRNVVKNLITYLLPKRRSVIMDNKHYNLIYIRLSSAPKLFMNLISSAAASLQATLRKARTYTASIALLSLAGGLAIMLLGPPVAIREEEVRRGELDISTKAQDLLVKELEFISKKNATKLNVLALEISRSKVASYKDVERIGRRVIKELGEENEHRRNSLSKDD